jgi:hypothetical protein
VFDTGQQARQVVVRQLEHVVVILWEEVVPHRIQIRVLEGFVWSANPCASPQPSIFFNYSFLVHHPVNPDDWHLLAHAMAADFSVAWQLLSKITIGFFMREQTP